MTLPDGQTGAGRTPRGWVRENVLLVAALGLPVLVIGFFLLTTIVPRWTVPDPAYDLVVSGASGWDVGPRHSMIFRVRDGRVVAEMAPVAAGNAAQRQQLYVFDHATLELRDVPVDVPSDLADAETRTFVVEALESRPVISTTRAPDGYMFQTRGSSGPGIIGDVFGMRRYEQRAAIARDGRAVPIELPVDYGYGLTALGWLEAR